MEQLPIVYYISFGAASKHWKAIQEQEQDRHPLPLPWLVAGQVEVKHGNGTLLCFCQVERKVRRVPIPHVDTYHERQFVIGSQDSYVIILKERHANASQYPVCFDRTFLHLLNPISRYEKSLTTLGICEQGKPMPFLAGIVGVPSAPMECFIAMVFRSEVNMCLGGGDWQSARPPTDLMELEPLIINARFFGGRLWCLLRDRFSLLVYNPQDLKDFMYIEMGKEIPYCGNFFWWNLKKSCCLLL